MIRTDLQIITNLIESSSRVLDIGCGDGELMNLLRQKKNCLTKGLELKPENVSRCMKAGLSVIQGDANRDLKFYPSKSFDYAILSQTLQAMQNPKATLEEMLRIANSAIVSVPNFAHWYNRLYLAMHGKMPVSKLLPFTWYETPNIHFCTIRDFYSLCDEMNYFVKKSIFLAKEKELSLKCAVNFFGEIGIFVIGDNRLRVKNQQTTTIGKTVNA